MLGYDKSRWVAEGAWPFGLACSSQSDRWRGFLQVHKAQPIRHYKPVALKKSELPLTVPQSPNFCDRFRL